MHHLKIWWIYNIDYIRIAENESKAVILSQTKSIVKHREKCDVKTLQKKNKTDCLMKHINVK